MAGVDLLATAFSGANAAFIADLYARWVAAPHSVDADFAELFAALNDESRAILEDNSGASWAPRRWGADEPVVARAPSAAEAASAEAVRAATKDSLRALMMIRTYRV